MKFFTRDWLRGQLTDAEFDAVPGDYRRHVATLRLPPDVHTLTQVNIHDGLLFTTEYEPQLGRLVLVLRCGDLQRGYSDLRIEYAGATLGNESLLTLRHAAEEPKIEFLYDEVDRVGDRFEHRFLLSSGSEVCVSFAAVSVSSSPVESRWAT